MCVYECFFGTAPETVMWVSFSGEIAYELQILTASLYGIYLALREASKTHDMN